MNPKERIEAAFLKIKTDVIPINHRGFSSKAASYVLNREAFVGGGIQCWREAKALFEGWHQEYLERSFRDAIDLALATGQDLIRPEYWRAPKKPTRKIDENTYLYEYGRKEDWEILQFDPSNEQARFFNYQQRELTLEDIKRKIETAESDLSVYQPLEPDFQFQIDAQKLCGETHAVEVGGVGVGIPHEASLWFEAMLLDPGLIRTYINQQVEKARKKIEFLAGYGFRYFLGGGDFASESGPIYSPTLFRKLILPGLKAVSEICHRHNSYHFFASDGNLWPVADALFGESGVDCYYEIDRKAGMDLVVLRERFPGLALMGNISSWTMSQGNVEDVRNEVAVCLETAKKFQGVIVGVSNYILPETSSQNIDVLIETIKEYR